jgi:Predicted membrane protein
MGSNGGIKMTIKTKQLTLSGVLIAITVVLGVTGIGFIPVPTLAGAATLMHLPSVLAGIVGLEWVSPIIGLVFGLSSFKYMGDLRVVIPARLLIGIVTFLIFALLKKKKWAIPIAAACGSIFNTVGTLGLGVLCGYIPAVGAGGAVAIGLANGIPEAILSAIIITPIALAVLRYMKART